MLAHVRIVGDFVPLERLDQAPDVVDELMWDRLVMILEPRLADVQESVQNHGGIPYVDATTVYEERQPIVVADQVGVNVAIDIRRRRLLGRGRLRHLVAIDELRKFAPSLDATGGRSDTHGLSPWGFMSS